MGEHLIALKELVIPRTIECYANHLGLWGESTSSVGESKILSKQKGKTKTKIVKVSKSLLEGENKSKKGIKPFLSTDPHLFCFKHTRLSAVRCVERGVEERDKCLGTIHK